MIRVRVRAYRVATYGHILNPAPRVPRNHGRPARRRPATNRPGGGGNVSAAAHLNTKTHALPRVRFPTPLPGAPFSSIPVDGVRSTPLAQPSSPSSALRFLSAAPPPCGSSPAATTPGQPALADAVTPARALATRAPSCASPSPPLSRSRPRPAQERPRSGIPTAPPHRLPTGPHCRSPAPPP